MFYCDLIQAKQEVCQNQNTKVYEVNIRSVVAAVLIGQAGLKTFCADHAHRLTKKSFNSILHCLSKQSEKQAETILKEAAHRLR